MTSLPLVPDAAARPHPAVVLELSEAGDVVPADVGVRLRRRLVGPTW